MLELDEIINSVLIGDCREVLKSIPNESIDMILTDPPFGINYKSGKWHGHYIRGRHRVIPKDISPIEGDDKIIDFFAEAHRLLKPTGAIYVFGSWRTSDKWKQLIEHHFILRNKLVWVKNNHTMGSWVHQYRNKYLLCLPSM
jgi:site-specific DNA-methyltransferase (adenine-specific)